MLVSRSPSEAKNPSPRRQVDGVDAGKYQRGHVSRRGIAPPPVACPGREECAMGADSALIPTPPTIPPAPQRWSAVFAGEEYYYGTEPGPVARRAVRYHRQYRARGGS